MRNNIVGNASLRPAEARWLLPTLTQGLPTMRIPFPRLFVLACLVLAFHSRAAQAESTELRLARQYGIGYLQMMVMEHEKLIEKKAAAAGLGDIAITWMTFADGTGASDAILSGNLDIAAGGLGSFVTLWERTRNTIGVKGIAALNSMPMLLNTRNPDLQSIRDLTERDRIAVAGIKVSSQATTLQLAAAQTFGVDNWNRLDHLTVNLGHPTAMQLLLQEGSDVDAHFASPPFQNQELRRPGIHTILNSYDVWGGPQTFVLVWTTTRFRDGNPRLYKAFIAALKEATEFINHKPRAAAEMYLQMTGERTMTADELVALLGIPDISFTLVPQNVVKFAAFKAQIGNVSGRPDTWKDLFFPEIHALPGS
jgi:NitT/TauT family transport system substrate-binding protein